MVLRSTRIPILLGAGLAAVLAPSFARAEQPLGMPVVAGYQPIKQEQAGKGKAGGAISALMRFAAAKDDGRANDDRLPEFRSRMLPIPDGSAEATTRPQDRPPVSSATRAAAGPTPDDVAAPGADRSRAGMCALRLSCLIAGVPFPEVGRFLIGVEADLGVQVVRERPAMMPDARFAGRAGSAIGQFVLFGPFPLSNRNSAADPGRFHDRVALPTAAQRDGPAPDPGQAVPSAWLRLAGMDFAMTEDIGGGINHFRLALRGFR